MSDSRQGPGWWKATDGKWYAPEYHPEADAEGKRRPPARQVEETRCTCSACGRVWHYGKRDVALQKAARQQQVGKAMMCCGGCAPAVLIPDKEIPDLDKCPSCGSRAVKKETVTHDVE